MTPDGLPSLDRVYLDRLHLATQVLLSAAEETGLLNDVIESELVLVKEKLERALLLGPDIRHSA